MPESFLERGFSQYSVRETRIGRYLYTWWISLPSAITVGLSTLATVGSLEQF